MANIFLLCFFQGIFFKICAPQINTPSTTTTALTTTPTLGTSKSTTTTSTTTTSTTTTSTTTTATYSSLDSTIISTTFSTTGGVITPTAIDYVSSATTDYKALSSVSQLHTRPITETQNTTLLYYVVGKGMDAVWTKTTDVDKALVKEILIKKDLSMSVVKFPTDFIFYGHRITVIGITTSGFLFTSKFLYENLMFSHYIAPLMAHFETKSNPLSSIKYFLNGTTLIVWYENVNLYQQNASFTFQVILHKNGNIIFNYKDIPISFDKIDDTKHRVVAGLSDAFAFDTNHPLYVRLYEYNRLTIPDFFIVSNSSVYLNIVETCLNQTSCADCFDAKKRIPFNCQWCPSLGRCSDGLDRRRQQWLNYSCPIERVTDKSKCDQLIGTAPGASGSTDDTGLTAKKPSSEKYLGLLALLLLIPLVAIAGWIAYAARNPDSRSGQFYLQNNPSQCWNSFKDRLQNQKQQPASYVSFDNPQSYA